MATVVRFEIEHDDDDFWAVGFAADGTPIDDVVVPIWNRHHSTCMIVVRDAARDRWPDAREARRG